MIFLTQNKLLSALHHGFIGGRSTSTAIQDLVLYVTNYVNSRKICGALLIDISKTFDSLNHDFIISKLEGYGIRRKSCPWFKSYLNSRKQRTLFNGLESLPSVVTQGVPQGSTLGPFLYIYILYVNDCFDVLIKDNISSILMYADDTVLLTCG